MVFGAVVDGYDVVKAMEAAGSDSGKVCHPPPSHEFESPGLITLSEGAEKGCSERREALST